MGEPSAANNAPAATAPVVTEQAPARVDTREFFFTGGGVSALLIHGLTGTPYEMRYLGEQLAGAGIRVRGVRLAGHAGQPEELATAGYDNWYESVVEGFEHLRGFGDPIVAIGLSAGAVLGVRLALDRGAEIAGLGLLAPAFFLPRQVSIALGALRLLGSVTRRVFILSTGGSDIHDTAAHRIHPTTRLTPLSGPINLLDLSAMVRPRLGALSQPALIIHSHGDHTCPYERNVDFVMSRLGSARKRLVELHESYHVITVDTDRERVAGEVLDFVSQFRTAHRATAAV
jgi:carboxylesterase